MSKKTRSVPYKYRAKIGGAPAILGLFNLHAEGVLIPAPEGTEATPFSRKGDLDAAVRRTFDIKQLVKGSTLLDALPEIATIRYEGEISTEAFITTTPVTVAAPEGKPEASNPNQTEVFAKSLPTEAPPVVPDGVSVSAS